MKEVKHFICDICHTEYNDKPKCAECEKSHKEPIKIIRTRYVAQDKNGQGYPVSIEVEFKDGSVKRYKR